MIRKFVVERDKVVIAGELNLPQLVVLGTLNFKGPHKAGELAEATDFSPSMLTALCNKLVDGGYIERTRPEEDRRTVLLAISAKGKEFIETLSRSKRKDKAPYLFEEFNEEELKLLLNFSGRILKRLDGFSEAIMAEIEQALTPERPADK
ncbi:MarR family transcriptional regulator [Cohnella thailandensis]|uniref:MarR family transcriptional regulator n=1 Tax=Cohnella thailandensis TaxID=557557 RepID=A0A841SW27_9BACL|nr:MarR family transcriptional regulator [Cohnella thailandensis]MBB6634816.1 MarR family transcriptional regulator [Cohnella thailandensis]MBP1975963.1 DNA-binding MarR family transcriptional regulator [Cohnella thailandensis]